MNMITGAKRTLCAAMVVATFLTSGCGSSAAPTQTTSGVVTIDPKVLLASISTAIQQPVARALGGWEWGSFISSFGTLLTSLNYTIEMQKITYQSTGADGLPHTMTGLLILPRAIFGAKPSVPILMYQHGTEPYRPYSPSQYLAHQDRPTDYPEVMVSAAIAASGYAVALADYEGLGDSTGTQPYVHGTSLAQQVIDMLRASRDKIGGIGSPCSWNSQLFLMGYSEGGYVTMTTTRELQLKHAGEFTVTAAAPLSGPHDLSGEMRTLMLSNNTSKAPYFLPFLLSGYNYASGGTLFRPDTSLLPPHSSRLPPLFAGNTPSDSISTAMGMVYSPVALIAPKSVLTPLLIAQLTLPSSPEVAFLRQNDSYRDPLNVNAAWVPTVPVRLYHHRNDELVPYSNSQVAFDAFSTAGAKNRILRGPGVELVEERATVNVSPDPVKTVHLGAAFPELSNGWRWLDGFKR